MSDVQAIVLAAGQASRFRTEKTKLVEQICGQELIIYVTKLLESLSVPTTVVVGYQKELLMSVINQYHQNNITFINQDNRHGTGHALKCTREQWKSKYILVLNGDIPLLKPSLIEALYLEHTKTDSIFSFVTAHHNAPSSSYGRVIQDKHGIRIVEAHEFTMDPQEHCCINAGVYIINREFLEHEIDNLEHNAQTKELYIVDLIRRANNDGCKITTISVPFDQVRGVNTLEELWIAEQIKRSELVRYWMDLGVRFMSAHDTHLDLSVRIGTASYIGADAHLLGNTILENHCHIAPFSIIENSVIGAGSRVHGFSVIKNAQIGPNCDIGPFAHVQNTTIGHSSVVGNFVQTKQSHIGSNTKAKHHAYLGDAFIGNKVNIGAGTITCNHDGVTKHATTILDNAYIGSNNSLVAPIVIGANAFTAAGSVITKDVPDNALAIGRAHQINKLSYSNKINRNKNHTIGNDDQLVANAEKISKETIDSV